MWNLGLAVPMARKRYLSPIPLWDIRQRFQIGPGRDAVELDSIEFDSPVLQIHYPTRNKVSGARGFLIKDAVVIPRHEDSEFRRNGIIPTEEVL